MRLALEEASLAFKENEVPVGAVLIDRDGEVLARAHNQRESIGDPTAHAEITALRIGATRKGQWRLEDTTLYVTKEPCVMCAGAMINSRLKRVVFGCRDAKRGAVESLYRLVSDLRMNHRVEVTAGILENEGRKILQDFFLARRTTSQKLKTIKSY